MRFMHSIALTGATILWAPSAIVGFAGVLFGGFGVLAGPIGAATHTNHVLLAVVGAILFGIGFGLHEWHDHHWCDICEQNAHR